MEAKWICGLVGLASALGMAVLFHHADASVGANVISLAQSIVTGAFGVAYGHSLSKNGFDPSKLPPGSSQTDATITNIPPAPIDSVTPAASPAE